MNLVQSYIRPGKIREVVNKYGVVKCSVVGIFKDDEDLEKLPPIYPSPFMKTSANNFVKPQVGDDVWVMLFKDNTQMLFYSFQGVTNEDELAPDYDDIEIISKHDNSILMFDNEDGWYIRNKNCFINISDDSVKIDNQKYHISIDNDGIVIGDDSDSQPMVLGNELKDALKELCKCLQNTATVAMGNPMTIPIGTAISTGVLHFERKLQKILSKDNYLT